jgi:hypothetical protein
VVKDLPKLGPVLWQMKREADDVVGLPPQWSVVEDQPR